MKVHIRQNILSIHALLVSEKNASMRCCSYLYYRVPKTFKTFHWRSLEDVYSGEDTRSTVRMTADVVRGWPWYTHGLR